MRIVGGRFTGRKLAAVGAGAPDAHLRPTTDRVREALFNVLAHGPYPPLEGARVLDLFAGVGALGLEAMSRGAARAVFVDDDARARALIRENVELLGLTGVTKIFRRDATRLGPNRGAPFDILFLDPPYGTALGGRAAAAALDGDWVAPDAVIVLETGPEDPDPGRPEIQEVDDRRYGATRIRLFTRSETRSRDD